MMDKYLVIYKGKWCEMEHELSAGCEEGAVQDLIDDGIIESDADVIEVALLYQTGE